MIREQQSRTVAKLCARPGCGRFLPGGRSKFCGDACYKAVQQNRSFRIQVIESESNEKHLDRVGNVKYAKRTCLGSGCTRSFWSTGPWNRFCPRCSKANENAIQPGVRRARVVDAESGYRPVDHLPRGDW